MADFRHKGFDLRSIYLNTTIAEIMDLIRQRQQTREIHRIPDIPRHRPVPRAELRAYGMSLEPKSKEQK